MEWPSSVVRRPSFVAGPSMPVVYLLPPAAPGKEGNTMTIGTVELFIILLIVLILVGGLVLLARRR